MSSFQSLMFRLKPEHRRLIYVASLSSRLMGHHIERRIALAITEAMTLQKMPGMFEAAAMLFKNAWKNLPLDEILQKHNLNLENVLNVNDEQVLTELVNAIEKATPKWLRYTGPAVQRYEATKILFALRVATSSRSQFALASQYAYEDLEAMPPGLLTFFHHHITYMSITT